MTDKDFDKYHKKYIAAALLLCFCFFVCSLLFVFFMMKKSEQENLQYLRNASKQMKITIDKQFQGDFQTLEGLAIYIGDSGAIESDRIINSLQKINDHNSFLRMGVSDLKGNANLFDIHSNRQLPLNIYDFQFFQVALRDGEAISDTYPDPFSPDQFIYYYGVMIKNSINQPIGMLCAVNSTDILRKIIDTPILSNKGFSSIVDSKGNFVIHSKNTKTSMMHINDIGKIDPNQYKTIQNAMSKNKSICFKYQERGEEKYAMLEPIGINDWFLLNVVPKTALRQRYNMTAVGMLMIIATACIIFFILFYQQRKMMEKNRAELMHLAYDDLLTGKRNFSKFIIDGEHIIQVHNQTNYVVWYCDLKKFKYFNDVFGYDKGDRLLLWTSEQFEKTIRENEIFCRISADNFVGLRRYEKKEELKIWFDQLLAALWAEQSNDAKQLHVEFSMGFYCIHDSNESLTLNEMVNRANIAQKTAKNLPGSQFAFFDNEIRKRILLDSEMEAQAKHALAANEFILYFQPKINIQKGNYIAGAEALVRWKHPKRGLIFPVEFIPLFEKNEMIVQLDRYMLVQACKWCRAWLDKGERPINIAINVSRIDMMQDDFIDYYVSVKQKYQIPNQLLELEFTESVILNNNCIFLKRVCELQDNGFVVSLDDFGAGYSSLNLLKNLPIDVLKLDILFFRESVDVVRERIVVSNIIHMAKQLQIKTIAEGVEMIEQVEFLRHAGCNIVQGYVFSKPMSCDDFMIYAHKNLQRTIIPKDVE